ncbi:DUF2267 domain-containing protein [Oricola sp.]|uniref:DUF2267 domain-containing protein n=1 Tax=Oricola sp. TaxID=1979950 RepID=UPI003BA96177
MPMPQEYFNASRDFDAFMADAKASLGHGSHHQTYTTVDAVLIVFRRRLSARDGLRFASALPPVLRAIFVANWDPEEARSTFGTRADLEAEAKAIRPDHNFSPDGAIAIVASVLWRHVDREDFERMLAALPDEARDYWA